MTAAWQTVHRDLDDNGYALLGTLLTNSECEQLKQGYDDPARFYKTVVMERHGFGKGNYKYYDDPLPEPITRLRDDFYPHLASIANDWHERIGSRTRYPESFARYAARCRRAGQRLPTPLILRYEAGGFNCLHQDLYGDEVFPLQLTILLSRPGIDFYGGEFLLTEQRPRRQSRAEVIPLDQGEAVLFPVQWRPVAGKRKEYKATMRHGVSSVRGGLRFAAGIIFHGAS